MLAFPASAQTGSDPNSAGAAGARIQSESTGGPIGSGPATAKTDTDTDTDTANPNTQTDSTAAKPESQPGGSQPQSNSGPKKAGSAILIDINKAQQKMTVLEMGYKNTNGRYQPVEPDTLLQQETIPRPR